MPSCTLCSFLLALTPSRQMTYFCHPSLLPRCLFHTGNIRHTPKRYKQRHGGRDQHGNELNAGGVDDPEKYVRIHVFAGIALRGGTSVAVILVSLCQCVDDGERGSHQNSHENKSKCAHNFVLQPFALRYRQFQLQIPSFSARKTAYAVLLQLLCSRSNLRLGKV